MLDACSTDTASYFLASSNFAGRTKNTRPNQLAINDAVRYGNPMGCPSGVDPFDGLRNSRARSTTTSGLKKPTTITKANKLVTGASTNCYATCAPTPFSQAVEQGITERDGGKPVTVSNTVTDTDFVYRYVQPRLGGTTFERAQDVAVASGDALPNLDAAGPAASIQLQTIAEALYEVARVAPSKFRLKTSNTKFWTGLSFIADLDCVSLDGTTCAPASLGLTRKDILLYNTKKCKAQQTCGIYLQLQNHNGFRLSVIESTSRGAEVVLVSTVGADAAARANNHCGPSASAEDAAHWDKPTGNTGYGGSQPTCTRKTAIGATGASRFQPRQCPLQPGQTAAGKDYTLQFYDPDTDMTYWLEDPESNHWKQPKFFDADRPAKTHSTRLAQFSTPGRPAKLAELNGAVWNSLIPADAFRPGVSRRFFVPCGPTGDFVGEFDTKQGKVPAGKCYDPATAQGQKSLSKNKGRAVYTRQGDECIAAPDVWEVECQAEDGIFSRAGTARHNSWYNTITQKTYTFYTKADGPNGDRLTDKNTQFFFDLSGASLFGFSSAKEYADIMSLLPRIDAADDYFRLGTNTYTALGSKNGFNRHKRANCKYGAGRDDWGFIAVADGRTCIKERANDWEPCQPPTGLNGDQSPGVQHFNFKTGRVMRFQQEVQSFGYASLGRLSSQILDQKLTRLANSAGPAKYFTATDAADFVLAMYGPLGYHKAAKNGVAKRHMMIAPEQGSSWNHAVVTDAGYHRTYQVENWKHKWGSSNLGAMFEGTFNGYASKSSCADLDNDDYIMFAASSWEPRSCGFYSAKFGKTLGLLQLPPTENSNKNRFSYQEATTLATSQNGRLWAPANDDELTAVHVELMHELNVDQKRRGVFWINGYLGAGSAPAWTNSFVASHWEAPKASLVATKDIGMAWNAQLLGEKAFGVPTGRNYRAIIEVDGDNCPALPVYDKTTLLCDGDTDEAKANRFVFCPGDDNSQELCSTYYFSEGEKINFREAKRNAIQMGSYLLDFNTQAEYDFIKGIVNGRGSWKRQDWMTSYVFGNNKWGQYFNHNGGDTSFLFPNGPSSPPAWDGSKSSKGVPSMWANAVNEFAVPNKQHKDRVHPIGIVNFKHDNAAGFQGRMIAKGEWGRYGVIYEKQMSQTESNDFRALKAADAPASDLSSFCYSLPTAADPLVCQPNMDVGCPDSTPVPKIYRCDDDDQHFQYGSSVYRVTTKKGNWEQYVASAANFGANLVKIDTAGEADFLINTVMPILKKQHKDATMWLSSTGDLEFDRNADHFEPDPALRGPNTPFDSQGQGADQACGANEEMHAAGCYWQLDYPKDTAERTHIALAYNWRKVPALRNVKPGGHRWFVFEYPAAELGTFTDAEGNVQQKCIDFEEPLPEDDVLQCSDPNWMPEGQSLNTEQYIFCEDPEADTCSQYAYLTNYPEKAGAQHPNKKCRDGKLCPPARFHYSAALEEAQMLQMEDGSAMPSDLKIVEVNSWREWKFLYYGIYRRWKQNIGDMNMNGQMWLGLTDGIDARKADVENSPPGAHEGTWRYTSDGLSDSVPADSTTPWGIPHRLAWHLRNEEITGHEKGADAAMLRYRDGFFEDVTYRHHRLTALFEFTVPNPNKLQGPNEANPGAQREAECAIRRPPMDFDALPCTCAGTPADYWQRNSDNHVFVRLRKALRPYQATTYLAHVKSSFEKACQQANSPCTAEVNLMDLSTREKDLFVKWSHIGGGKDLLFGADRNQQCSRDDIALGSCPHDQPWLWPDQSPVANSQVPYHMARDVDNWQNWAHWDRLDKLTTNGRYRNFAGVHKNGVWVHLHRHARKPVFEVLLKDANGDAIDFDESVLSNINGCPLLPLESNCPDTAWLNRETNTIYRFSSNRFRQEDGRAEAAALGGKLVEFESQAELDWVNHNVFAYPFDKVHAFIGATAPSELTNEGECCRPGYNHGDMRDFFWGDGEALSTTVSHFGPESVHAKSLDNKGGKQDCVFANCHHRHNDGRWWCDAHCNHRAMSLIEIAVPADRNPDEMLAELSGGCGCDCDIIRGRAAECNTEICLPPDEDEGRADWACVPTVKVGEPCNDRDQWTTDDCCTVDGKCKGVDGGAPARCKITGDPHYKRSFGGSKVLHIQDPGYHIIGQMGQFLFEGDTWACAGPGRARCQSLQCFTVPALKDGGVVNGVFLRACVERYTRTEILIDITSTMAVPAGKHRHISPQATQGMAWNTDATHYAGFYWERLGVVDLTKKTASGHGIQISVANVLRDGPGYAAFSAPRADKYLNGAAPDMRSYASIPSEERDQYYTSLFAKMITRRGKSEWKFNYNQFPNVGAGNDAQGNQVAVPVPRPASQSCRESPNALCDNAQEVVVYDKLSGISLRRWTPDMAHLEDYPLGDKEDRVLLQTYWRMHGRMPDHMNGRCGNCEADKPCNLDTGLPIDSCDDVPAQRNRVQSCCEFMAIKMSEQHSNDLRNTPHCKEACQEESGSCVVDMCEGTDPEMEGNFEIINNNEAVWSGDFGQACWDRIQSEIDEACDSTEGQQCCIETSKQACPSFRDASGMIVPTIKIGGKEYKWASKNRVRYSDPPDANNPDLEADDGRQNSIEDFTEADPCFQPVAFESIQELRDVVAYLREHNKAGHGNKVDKIWVGLEFTDNRWEWSTGTEAFEHQDYDFLAEFPEVTVSSFPQLSTRLAAENTYEREDKNGNPDPRVNVMLTFDSTREANNYVLFPYDDQAWGCALMEDVCPTRPEVLCGTPDAWCEHVPGGFCTTDPNEDPDDAPGVQFEEDGVQLWTGECRCHSDADKGYFTMEGSENNCEVCDVCNPSAGCMTPWADPCAPKLNMDPSLTPAEELAAMLTSDRYIVEGVLDSDRFEWSCTVDVPRSSEAYGHAQCGCREGFQPNEYCPTWADIIDNQNNDAGITTGRRSKFDTEAIVRDYSGRVYDNSVENCQCVDVNECELPTPVCKDQRSDHTLDAARFPMRVFPWGSVLCKNTYGDFDCTCMDGMEGNAPQVDEPGNPTCEAIPVCNGNEHPDGTEDPNYPCKSDLCPEYKDGRGTTCVDRNPQFEPAGRSAKCGCMPGWVGGWFSTEEGEAFCCQEEDTDDPTTDDGCEDEVKVNGVCPCDATRTVVGDVGASVDLPSTWSFTDGDGGSFLVEISFDQSIQDVKFASPRVYPGPNAGTFHPIGSAAFELSVTPTSSVSEVYKATARVASVNDANELLNSLKLTTAYARAAEPLSFALKVRVVQAMHALETRDEEGTLVETRWVSAQVCINLQADCTNQAMVGCKSGKSKRGVSREWAVCAGQCTPDLYASNQADARCGQLSDGETCCARVVTDPPTPLESLCYPTDICHISPPAPEEQ